MNRAANTQRTLALVFLVTGLGMVLIGIVLGLAIDPLLFVVSGVGLTDLVLARLYLSRGERAVPTDISELQE